jgi:hypothetical protein
LVAKTRRRAVKHLRNRAFVATVGLAVFLAANGATVVWGNRIVWGD